MNSKYVFIKVVELFYILHDDITFNVAVFLNRRSAADFYRSQKLLLLERGDSND
jgi:hypothetical protein